MKNWFKYVLFLGLSFMFFTACTKDLDDEPSYMGNWIEESPVENRTELVFLTPSVVVIANAENSVNEFRYDIEGDSIFLTLADDYPDGNTQAFFFKQVDENSLQIENLYPSIPEEEPTFIIFERD